MTWETREQTIRRMDREAPLALDGRAEVAEAECPACGRTVSTWEGKLMPHGSELGPCRGPVELASTRIAHARIDALGQALRSLTMAVDILSKRVKALQAQGGK